MHIAPSRETGLIRQPYSPRKMTALDVPAGPGVPFINRQRGNTPACRWIIEEAERGLEPEQIH